MRNLFTKIIATTVSIVMLSLPAYAQLNLDASGITVSPVYSNEEYIPVEQKIMDRSGYLGVYPLSFDYSFLTENGSIYYTGDEEAEVSEVNELTETWVRDNIRGIVPEGVSACDAVQITADWIADRMTYKYNRSSCPRPRIYQTALCCYTEGEGVCATYALAFNQIVGRTPYNPVTWTVDYSCQTPAYLRVSPVYNSQHCWSAVNMAGVWHYYDICMYDSGIYGRRPEYFDMKQMDKDYYQNPYIVLT